MAGFHLVLGDGYPYPYPQNITDDQQDEIVADMPVEAIRLKGVSSVEWRFEFTVQFSDRASMMAAKDATGWDFWDEAERILKAETSHKDGREFPAIIVGDKAYCRLYFDGEAE